MHSVLALLLLLAPPTAESKASAEKCVSKLAFDAKADRKGAWAQYKAGIRFMDAGKSKQSRAAFESCARKDPGLAQCYYGLADLMRHVGEQKHAKLCDTAAAKLGPRLGEVLDDMCEHPACGE